MGNRQPRQLEIPIVPEAGGDANIEQIINQRVRRRRQERPALIGQGYAQKRGGTSLRM